MNRYIRTSLFLLTSFFFAASALAQTSAFTYQGNLNEDGGPANGSYDFEFALFDALEAGSQVGPTVTRIGVEVSNGSFSVSLDFGAMFPGSARYLEIRVRPSAPLSDDKDSLGSLTTLSPRETVLSSPYAVRSLSAASADLAANSSQLGGVAAGEYVLTTDPRMTDARTPTSGSSDYIQNTTTQQATSNFNISGTGRASILDAATRFDIGGVTVLKVFGDTNPNSTTLLGIGAGISNTADRNSFFGLNSGAANTSATSNSFFGFHSGIGNSIGERNSFFGASAGASNGSGSENAYFGTGSAANLSGGTMNSFFGAATGAVASGDFNSFFGHGSGFSSSGSSNSFFGNSTGAANEGSNNAFFGREAGAANVSGSNNTAIGRTANFGSDNLTYATALGSDALATASNTIQLGRDGLDTVRIGALGAAGATSLCQNELKEISSCSSSIRYKENVERFVSGLRVLKHLRPVTFNWKDSGVFDLGLVAEEVAEIEPLLVTYKNGKVEGVKYDRLGVMLVNVVREQQERIENQENEITSLKSKLAALKALVCATNEAAKICAQ